MPSDQPIRNWRQDFWFLDNSYETPIAYEGLMYPTVTHAFAGAQAGELDLKLEISQTPLGALEDLVVERIGDLVPGFEGPNTMRKLLEYKFGLSQMKNVMSAHQIKMAEKLLFTGRRPIIYGNMSCNTFWGDCACVKHLETRGKNVLGGLIMGVRDKIIENITNGVAKDQTCNCEKPNEAFFLYAHEGKLWLKPYCPACVTQCGVFLSKLSDNNQVQRFEKEWFKVDRGPASQPKKQKPVNHQIVTKNMSHTIHPVFTESGIPVDDDFDDLDGDYARAWAAWGGGHMGASRTPAPPEPKLSKNITFYLSGKIS